MAVVPHFSDLNTLRSEIDALRNRCEELCVVEQVLRRKLNTTVTALRLYADSDSWTSDAGCNVVVWESDEYRFAPWKIAEQALSEAER
jgi:hypothetical protein